MSDHDRTGILCPPLPCSLYKPMDFLYEYIYHYLFRQTLKLFTKVEGSYYGDTQLYIAKVFGHDRYAAHFR